MRSKMGTPGGVFLFLLVLITAGNIPAVQFDCKGTRCRAGLDCIGGARCADPCENYVELKDDWRAIETPPLTNNCDEHIERKGWVRLFLGGRSAHIPEHCVGPLRCGTGAPMWMAGQHPTQLGELVPRTVCSSFYGGCCIHQNKTIHVKLCSNADSIFYVYKLVKPPGCNYAYCAELDPPRLSQIICGPDKIEVGVARANMTAAGYEPLTAHLAFHNCSWTREQDGVVWFKADIWAGACGNTLTTNSTHVIYSNTLSIQPAKSDSSPPLRLPFSCEYPLKTDARLKVNIQLPNEEVGQHHNLPLVIGDPSHQSGAVKVDPPRWEEGAFVGTGATQASMTLLQESKYTETYAAGAEGFQLHVGVSVDKSDPSLVVVLEDCFASPSSDSDRTGQYSLIQNKCPTKRQQVSVIESGSSHQARFSALLFLLQGEPRDFDLHCRLSLCDQRSSSCSPGCEDLDPTFPSRLICGSDKMEVGMDSAHVRRAGFNPLTAHLAFRNSSRARVQDGVVWYEADAQAGACGNTLTTNSTHVIYSNTLFIYPESAAFSYLPLRLPVSCVYPLKTDTRLTITSILAPNEEVGQHHNLPPDDPARQSGAAKVDPPRWMEGVFVGLGSDVRASMVLFHRWDYTEPYAAGPVVLPLGSQLHVGVSVDKSDPSLVVVLEDCFASHSSDPDTPERFSLIRSKCPANRQQVFKVESGSSLQAHFSTLPFALEGQNQDVYLHCSLSLCERRGSSCSPVCEDLDPPLLSQLICGPGKIQVGVNAASARHAGYEPLTGHLALVSCAQTREQDGVMWYEADTRAGACGNTLTTNSTHAIYSNTLSIQPAKNASSPPLRLPLSCEYPLKTDARLKVNIQLPNEEVGQHQNLPLVIGDPSHQSGAVKVDPPRWQVEEGAFVGTGATQASMTLLQESKYTETYAAGAEGFQLHVGVSVDKSDPSLVVVLEDCFASPSSDSDRTGQYSLIQNKCPTKRQQVSVIESGSSHQARFSALLFLLQGEPRDFDLHCRLSLCDQRSSSCSPGCEDLDPTFPSRLICGSGKMEVGMDSAHVRRAGFNPLTAHLAFRNSSRARVQDGVVWYEADAQAGACGNTLTTNSTHVIYSNTLFIYPESAAFSYLPLRLPVSCVYPLKTDTRLTITSILAPNEEVGQHHNLPPDDPARQSGAAKVDPPRWMEGVFVGLGSDVRASMVLFHRWDYTEPYAAGPVVLPLGSQLHVGVSVDKSDPSLVVVLEDCFASHSSDPDTPERFSLIRSKCPANRQQVFEVESGSSLQAHFSTLPFALEGQNQDVYLHCSLSLCERRGSSCSPVCEDLDPPLLSQLICGPGKIQVGVNAASARHAGYEPLTGHLALVSCAQTREQDGVMWYEADTRAGACGNTLTTNSTHAIYSNTLSIQPAKNASSPTLRLPLSCEYPLKTDARLKVNIQLPNEEVGQHQNLPLVIGDPSHQSGAVKVDPPRWEEGAFVGTGATQASMTLLQESKYTETYAAGAEGFQLHVGVSVDKSDPSLVVVLEDCFASPSSDSDRTGQYSLIQNKCPTKRQQVSVIESGSSHQARFSALLFLLQGEPRDFDLHCRLSLCDQRSSSCSPGCEDLDPTFPSRLICGSGKMEVGMDSAHVRRAGFNPLTAHLAFRNSSRARVQDGVVWYEADAQAGACGNTLTTNSTHVIYSNTLFIYPESAAFSYLPLRLPVSCVYPLKTDTRLTITSILAPNEEVGQHHNLPPDDPARQSGAAKVDPPRWMEGVFVGLGSDVRASMVLFHRWDYTEPYAAGPVVLPLGSQLHVGVSVDKSDPSLVVVLEDCFASHSSDPDTPERFSLIRSKCPANRQQVFEVESGSSLQAHFSTLPFALEGQNQDVYLHCSLSLCERRGSSCSPICEDLDPPLLSQLICGPGKIQVGVNAASARHAGYEPLTGHLALVSCAQTREQDGVMWYEADTRAGACGNTLTTNSTHAIYSNTLSIQPAKNASSPPLRLPLSCEYPLKTDARLKVNIQLPNEEVGQHQNLPLVIGDPSHQSGAVKVDPPRWQVEEGAFVGTGATQASMTLLQESKYTETYAAGAEGFQLHVGVSVDKSDPSLVVVLEDCFASPSSDSDRTGQYSLIQNKCPTKRQQVSVIESGSSHQARFSALLFLLQGEPRDFDLHCRLSLCDQRSSSCSPGCEDLDPTFPSRLICGSGKMEVGMDSAHVRRAGFNPLTAHLAFRNSSRARVQDGVVWYEADAQAGACGNTLTTNSTHVIYSNTLFIYPESAAFSYLPLRLPVSCVYPLKTDTRLTITSILAPNEEVGQHHNLPPDDPARQSGAAKVDPPRWMEGVFVGLGSDVRASMVLFHRWDYTEPYAAGPVVLPLGSQLHVGVSVDKSDPSLVVVLEDCFASHSSDPDTPERFSLIRSKCPANRQQVFEVESGSSLQAHFSTLPFALEGQNQDVYLHCSLSLCERRGSSCSPVCEDLDPPLLSQLICGPGKIQVGVNAASARHAGYEPLTGHLALVSCAQTREQDGVVWYEADTRAGACGNTLTTNSTHVIYSNTLFIYQARSAFSLPLRLPLSCVYPLKTDARLNVTIRPASFFSVQALHQDRGPIPTRSAAKRPSGQHHNLPPVDPSHQSGAVKVDPPRWMEGVFVGSGAKVRASMVLFKKPDYTEPYAASPVVLPLVSQLHVGVSVDKSDPSLVVVLDDCFASPSPDPDTPERVSLIHNKSATKRQQVSVVQSGSSHQARFSTPLFPLQKEYQDVYLYCSLSLCDRRSSSCIQLSDALGVSLSHLSCGPDKIEVGVDTASMTAAGLDPLTGHLASPTCSRARVQNGVVWYEADSQAGACGNILQTNSTHILYNNTLFIYPASSATVASAAILYWSCVYPLDTDTRLNVAVRPVLLPREEVGQHHNLPPVDPSHQSGAVKVDPPRRMEGVFVGSGAKVRVSMVLFKNWDYKETYPEGVVVLPVGSQLHVGVSVDKSDPSLVVVLEDCFASPSPDPDTPERVSLIHNKCPIKRQKVFVIESGSSLQARFSAQVYPLDQEYRDVYLHCSLSLCDQRSAFCIPSCPGRAKRSVPKSPPMKPLTIGPITWEKPSE
ncbi:uncharacterized protein LOC129192445 isoform X4 [Dunckerocampus dactyliophorus]|uniref:uncharacterized protein LOC129192445 isoform X4 n=1 Tax=Dunckerocampus dactyliophorus TaxID=161453 RepID=UPI0024075CAA|nr:uncharacterized protein LOC129192445 isoform X4 [Dunckerocampus dactyliophorus]